MSQALHAASSSEALEMIEKAQSLREQAALLQVKSSDADLASTRATIQDLGKKKPMSVR